MKTLIATSVMTALLISGVAVMAQGQNEEYLGLPGDNLNLYAVMNLFQESKTLEEFERNLNDENSRINNLDLNGDNLIDYINVFDNVHGNIHNIVLQVAVNKKEKQDVAVFTVERDKKGNVMIQLTGDEALYGKNYIIEPVFDEYAVTETPNPGYTGNAATINGRNVVVVRTSVVEIATWPLVTYIYSPDYIVWRSSWYWGFYPSYWSPWRPYYWHFYYGYHYNYYDHYYSCYRRWDHHRHDYWHEYYYRPYHSHSHYVAVNIKDGHYKSTYSHPEERRKGEMLYSTSHRDNSSQRYRDVSSSGQGRRSVPVADARNDRNKSGGNEAANRTDRVSTERTFSTYKKETYRNTSKSRTPEPSHRTETRTISNSRTMADSRPKAENRAAYDSRPKAASRPVEKRSMESVSRKPAPQKRESTPQVSRSKESHSKSGNSGSKSDSRRR